jgi:MFS family permease
MGELLQQTEKEQEQNILDDALIVSPEHSKTESVIEPETRDEPSALCEILSSHNYIVYLVTAWVVNAFTVLYSFLNLYLRQGLAWDFMLIGIVMSFTSAITAVMRFVGGYIGDVVDRKILAVSAMLLASLFHLLIGISEEFVLIVAALIVYSTIDIAKSGSSAYLMENIPQIHSGFALSLFTAGRSLGIITLIVFSVLTTLVGFANGFRYMFLISGILLLICTIGRACFLKGMFSDYRSSESSHLRGFLHENIKAIRYIFTSMPLVVTVVVVDAISDSLFKYGALIYANEVLGVSITGINIIMFLTLILSSMLVLKTGRISDKSGVKIAAIAIYSIMPISAVLLILAPLIPYWVPPYIPNAADAFIMGTGVIFSTPFLGILMKYVNDALWWLVILVIVKKQLPRSDTSKVLAVFMTTVYLFMSIGPFIGSLLFTFFEPANLFVLVLFLNLVILCVLLRSDFFEDDIMNNKEKTGKQNISQRKKE